MPESLNPPRRFNRREIKQALKSEHVELAEYLKRLPPKDTASLAASMFNELRLNDFTEYVFDCKDAINDIPEGEDDRREMLDAISRVIVDRSKNKPVDKEKCLNLSLATYFLLVRVQEISSNFSRTLN